MNKKKILKPFIITTSVILIIIAAFFIYTGIYYHGDMNAINSYTVENVTCTTYSKNVKIYSPKQTDTALIFYPGGKVQDISYEPLMKACAQKGIMCILIKMPFNLAVFDSNAAEDVRHELQKEYPNIKHWYIGGHSLGGSMAGSHLAKNTEDYDGLILLGSYITSDISQTDLNVLSIYGSEDKVMNHEKYNKYLSNLPGNYQEKIIEGGCHAYYGMYGKQKKDGTPSVSNIEQIEITAEFINEYIFQQTKTPS